MKNKFLSWLFKPLKKHFYALMAEVINDDINKTVLLYIRGEIVKQTEMTFCPAVGCTITFQDLRNVQQTFLVDRVNIGEAGGVIRLHGSLI